MPIRNNTLNKSVYTTDETSPVPDYTTAEQSTGRKWINGKVIYRQVFTGNLGTTSSVPPITGVKQLGTINGFSRLINVYGSIFQGITYSIPVTYSNPSANNGPGNHTTFNCNGGLDTGVPTILFGYAYNDFDYEVVVEYTK